jgi:hypothetical protein
MKCRFVVCHNPGTTEQDVTFKNWVVSRGYGWWHWLQGSWLIVDGLGSLTAAELREAVNAAYPGIYNIVIGVDDPNNWAGFGITSGPQNMFPWLGKTWH